MQRLVCESCGYDLNGLDESGVCPECGHNIGLSAKAHADWISSARIRALWPPVMRVSLLVLGFAVFIAMIEYPWRVHHSATSTIYLIVGGWGVAVFCFAVRLDGHDSACRVWAAFLLGIAMLLFAGIGSIPTISC